VVEEHLLRLGADDQLTDLAGLAFADVVVPVLSIHAATGAY
jgi:hypothetical protein